MTRLILIRHGQSIWNAENRFTGWTNVELSAQGEQEAQNAGNLLSKIKIDSIHTSDLIRAQKTAEIIMQNNVASKDFITYKDYRLNERNYGELQGLNKKETAEKHGADQVHIWRRSYDIAPPGGESLKMTAERTIPYFTEEIMPELKMGKNILISAHGNSLRSIVMHIEELTPEEIINVEIPTGEPRFYIYSDGKISKYR
ncbi:MAG: 2,3-bisphosphoglycerate-dependent phosphoglycerate mutase [Marine Group II euryarchaeote MED-G38]|nr:MAG: 2,3-bisphosphoglycerate-dependent phosphoglycerate mutase [Marine Group II euryarchaeote MED-G38]|tara:strand:+ start:7107 stop:7706 length:600 start_codon:yes stop_codon:yes gene_type:complete